MTTPPRWLSTLLQIRRQKRDNCRRQLGEAVRAKAVLSEKISSLQRTIAEATDMRRRTTASGTCDVNLLLSAQRHQAALHVDAKTASEQLELVEREVQRRQALVVEAEQQVRMLEKLYERKEQEIRREAARREGVRLDELATNMYQRGVSP